MAINKRASLRKFTDDIRRWVEEDRSDAWIASALGTSPSSVQSFRSRNAIYRRRTTTSTLHDPRDYSSYEGVLEPEGPGIWFDPEVGSDPRWQKRWSSTERVKLRLTSTRIVLLRPPLSLFPHTPVNRGKRLYRKENAPMSNRPEEPSDGMMAESQLSELQNMRVLLEEARGLSRNLAYHRRARLESTIGEALDEVDKQIQEMRAAKG